VTRERTLLDQLIKSWAQDHCAAYAIADFDNNQEAMEKTQGHFTWVIREGHANIDLQILADRIEVFLDRRRQRKTPDGMRCQKCHNFYEFAEPNQVNGSLICYSCLHPCG
jgi:formylmethanofuran dehydrogenase subunit E